MWEKGETKRGMEGRVKKDERAGARRWKRKRVGKGRTGGEMCGGKGVKV